MAEGDSRIFLFFCQLSTEMPELVTVEQLNFDLYCLLSLDLRRNCTKEIEIRFPNQTETKIFQQLLPLLNITCNSNGSEWFFVEFYQRL